MAKVNQHQLQIEDHVKPVYDCLAFVKPYKWTFKLYRLTFKRFGVDYTIDLKDTREYLKSIGFKPTDWVEEEITIDQMIDDFNNGIKPKEYYNVIAYRNKTPKELNLKGIEKYELK